MKPQLMGVGTGGIDPSLRDKTTNLYKEQADTTTLFRPVLYWI